MAVGNPKDFDKPLDTLGKVTPIDLTIPEIKQEVTTGDVASQARGKALLERAQQAMGGASALVGIKDSVQTLEMTMDAAAGGMKIKQVVRLMGSNLREDQILPIGTIVVYTDGKTGWMSTPQGVMNMPGEVLKQAQGEVFRDLVGLMLSSRDTARTVNAVG